MSLLTKHFFSTDKTHAASADITDIIPPLRGGCQYVSGSKGDSIRQAGTKGDIR